MTTQHTPTPWKSYGGGWLGNGAWSQVARVFTSHPPKGFNHAPAAREAEANVAFIIRAVNSHAALVELAEKIAAQDEFTFADSAPLGVKQVFGLINIWRDRASAALKLAKES